jgi:hypothetical protein
MPGSGSKVFSADRNQTIQVNKIRSSYESKRTGVSG